MSSPAIVAPSRSARFFRLWFPFLVLAGAALAIAVIWIWPEGERPRERRVTYTIVISMLAVFALAAWMLLASGWRWTWRLGLVVLLIGAAVGSIRKIEFTGDMVPIVLLRWLPTHDDVVAEHRRQQAAEGAQTAWTLLPDKPTDYPGYRGHNRDGVVVGPPLSRDWTVQPPRELWRQPAGGGYAGFAVAGNLAVTLEQRHEEEAVVGYDAATGRELWKYAYPAHFRETMGGPGPRATPTVAGGKVYSLGATGMLVCLDAATGAQEWAVDILDGNENLAWAMSGSPLVYDDVVVINPGSQTEASRGRALRALDRATGKERWAAGSQGAAYASPLLATVAGRRQVLIFDRAGLGGHDAKTGQELWRYPWETYQGINVAQPVVLEGDRLRRRLRHGQGRPGQWPLVGGESLAKRQHEVQVHESGRSPGIHLRPRRRDTRLPRRRDRRTRLERGSLRPRAAPPQRRSAGDLLRRWQVGPRRGHSKGPSRARRAAGL